MNIAIVGAGRAGTSFATALGDVGHTVRLVHHDELERVGDAEVVVLCVPDDEIAAVAAQLEPLESRVVVHVAGSRGLSEVSGHPRAALMHPLVVLSSREVGAARLRGALFSVDGHDVVNAIAASLGGRVIRLRDDQRAAYHATATVAANHLVALMGHIEVLAEAAGLTFEDFVPLIHQALSDVEERGAASALTGPASRSDFATIDAHLAAIPETERATYVALARVAFELAEQRRVSSAS
ncbi:MAG TPA: DUF2520 domain-containing protein [Acidimicrobiales bacterium]|nr:DUF2520 domain-containing protein [Acidimicrobiales bacterium]